ncbi:MAG: NERD domain-containing protein [Clostridia bacterium]|nr:NERD domain-containing protein [Clostridia bacterium]
MNEPLLLFLFIFLSVDALALFFLLIFKIKKEMKRNKIRHFGDRAEEEVSLLLEEEFPGCVILNNVLLKTSRGSTQIDHILLSKWGIYVIETKSHNGKITPGKKEWIQIYGEKVVRFHSPLLQNEIHKEALSRVLKKYRSFAHIPVKGVVVFTSKKLIFEKQLDGVVRLHELSPYIKSGGRTRNRRTLLTASLSEKYLSRQKIAALEKAIRQNTIRSSRKRKLHEKNIRRLDRNL